MTIYRSSKGNFEQHEEVEIFTDKYVSNVNGIASFTATGNKYFGAPGKPPVNTITNVVVEFRTKQTGYNGEFGFDWLRIDDGALTTEKAYEVCIEGGYEAPNGKAPHRDTNTSFETGEAFKALQKEYKQIVIARTSTTSKKYYVPWLNLFPKPVSDSTVVSTGPKPPFEAELRMLIDVEGTDPPDQIRIAFDAKYFTIDGKDGTDRNPVLIMDKIIGAKREVPSTIKITCIDEFSVDQEIKVYSYPKDSLSKPLATQMVLRKLAGKIIVGANKNTSKIGKTPAVNNRKTQKIVLVKVKTNINGVIGGDITGVFTPREKVNLQNALYQALIFGDIKDKDSSGRDIILDVTADINFKAGGKYISGGGILRTEPTLNTYMRTLINANTANAYIDCFYVFMFGINDSSNRVGGRVEDIGKKSVVLYKGRDNFTLNHEVLHGLSLYHTHADGVVDKPNQKYVYTHANVDSTKATDNIMSYQPDGKTSWYWQWKIIRKNV
ncbi:hypothetical protein [Pseudomonas shirazensis]